MEIWIERSERTIKIDIPGKKIRERVSKRIRERSRERERKRNQRTVSGSIPKQKATKKAR